MEHNPVRPKVYIAACYSFQAECRGLRVRLEKNGYDVVSTWIDVDERSTKDQTLGDHAERDLSDLMEADFLLFVGNSIYPYQVTTSGGGKNVEFGYALGMGIPVVVVGERENIFQHMEDVFWYDTMNAFFEEFPKDLTWEEMDDTYEEDPIEKEFQWNQ